MEKLYHFEPYAIEKYSRVTSEVSHEINKIAVSYDNDGRAEEANKLRAVMEKVCGVNEDLEKPDWSYDQLKSNASIIKRAINVLSEQDETRIDPEVTKLQGLYDCWQRIFEVKFEDK